MAYLQGPGIPGCGELVAGGVVVSRGGLGLPKLRPGQLDPLMQVSCPRPDPGGCYRSAHWDRLSLTRTRPGHWMGAMTPEQWQRQQDGPARLQITCRRGDEQWVLLREIEVEELPTTNDAPWARER